MSPICIITALPAESRIFIDALKLRHSAHQGIQLYANEPFLLLQTGIGKLKAAASTAALLHTQGTISAILNTGIAGSDADIGSVHLAHQVVDAGSGRQWYPHLPPQRALPQLPSASIHTVDTPNTHYRKGIVFDMEAAGVFSAASGYLSTDAIHSIKVISDNTSHALEKITPATASELMRECLPFVLQWSEWQQERQTVDTDTHSIDDYCQAIQSQVRHTVSETHQLRRLLQQYLTLIGQAPDIQTLQQQTNARDVRARLQSILHRSPLRYDA